MEGSKLRSYLAIFLIVIVISTSLTAVAWIWREGGIRKLSLSGPDYIFQAAQGTATLSLTVSPQSKLDVLEFRFRSLVERDMSELNLNVSMVRDLEDLRYAWASVEDRLKYFDLIEAGDYVSVHNVSITNEEDLRMVLFDFGKLYSCLYDSRHDNESLTSYAFLLNSTNHIVGCFEGYSDFVAVRKKRGVLLTRNDVLRLVRVQSGEEVEEYYGDADAEPSTEDLSPWGQIAFEQVETDEPYGVTLIIKEGKLSTGRLILCAETFGDGRWYPECSGYWLVKTELD